MKSWSLRREDLLEPREWARLRASLNSAAEVAERRRTWTAIQARAICFIAAWTGLRREELARLNVGDLRLTNDRPFLIVRRGKGGAYREVILSPDARRFLKRYLRAKDEYGEPVGPRSAVFRPQRGDRYTPDGIYRVWKAACCRAGLPPRSIHKARHLFASALYAVTKDLRLVQKQLGHERITTTTVYADVFDEDALAGMKALDKALRTLPVPPKNGRVRASRGRNPAGKRESSARRIRRRR